MGVMGGGSSGGKSAPAGSGIKYTFPENVEQVRREKKQDDGDFRSKTPKEFLSGRDGNDEKRYNR